MKRLRPLLAAITTAVVLMVVPAFAGAQMGPGIEPPAHHAAATPFYREPTFLVLVGAGLSAIGFGAYRVVRSRRRRRRGIAGLLPESVLVVDLVGSTRLATHYGDGLAMQAKTALKDRALAAAEAHGLAFVENTGDGWLMTFPSVRAAVTTALTLLEGLKAEPPALELGPPLEARIAITYGEILLDARGGRHGAVINKAFRLVGVGAESFARVHGESEQAGDVPDRNRIFLDEEATQELSRDDVHHRFVGFCRLKGFSGLHRVHQVLDEGRTP